MFVIQTHRSVIVLTAEELSPTRGHGYNFKLVFDILLGSLWTFCDAALCLTLFGWKRVVASAHNKRTIKHRGYLLPTTLLSFVLAVDGGLEHQSRACAEEKTTLSLVPQHILSLYDAMDVV